MPTQVHSTLAQGPNAIDECIDHVRAACGEPKLVFAFAATAFPLPEVAGAVRAAFPKATILSSSTAGEFTERGDKKNALTLVAVAGDIEVHAGIGRGLKENPEAAVAAALAGQPRASDGQHTTAIVLLDPMAGNGEETVLITASSLPPAAQLVGGAAGDDLKMTETWVGADGDVDTDAVVVAQIFSSTPLAVGVSHGHQSISDIRYKVTRAAGNVVAEIDGRRAWDVWRDATRAHAKARGVDVDHLAADDVGGFLLEYEAGLQSGQELKIRAPLAKDDQGALHFACGLPEGAEFVVTHSGGHRQVESAREAAKRASAQIDGPIAGAVVFDCICRNLILSHQFQDAVTAMSEELGGAPLAGFETYGEVALGQGDMSGFHNTTTVLLAFPAA